MKIYKFIGIALAALFIFGCGGAATVPSIVSPTDTLKNFIESSKKKDVEAIKKTLSKGSLELAEKSAKAQNTTVDELFRRESAAAMLEEVPEIRNEKIENETASVEVKDLTSGYDTIPFVKEDGVWKIAFDKYQQVLLEKMRQEMNAPESNPAKAAETDSSTTVPDKSKTDK